MRNKCIMQIFREGKIWPINPDIALPVSEVSVFVRESKQVLKLLPLRYAIILGGKTRTRRGKNFGSFDSNECRPLFSEGVE